MEKPFVRIQPAAAVQRVFQADGCGLAEGNPDVKFIIALQIAPVNDAENLPSMVNPVRARKLRGDGADLAFQAIGGGHVIACFQRGLGGGGIPFVDFP